jgi:hypothetical protein
MGIARNLARLVPNGSGLLPNANNYIGMNSAARNYGFTVMEIAP